MKQVIFSLNNLRNEILSKRESFIYIYLIFLLFFLGINNSTSQCSTISSGVGCSIPGIPCGTLSPNGVTVKVYIHNIKNTACSGGMTSAELTALKTYLSSVYSTINVTLYFPPCNLDFCDNAVYNNPLSVVNYYSTRSFNDGINAYISTNLNTGNAEEIPSLNFYSSPHHSTVAHELGHCLGLFHTFECPTGIRECADQSNGEIAGDLVCDTNADPDKGVDLSTCSRNNEILLDNDPLLNPQCFDNTISCNGTRYDPPATNIMSYYIMQGGANCQSTFTSGQAERMKIALATCSVLEKITNGGCIEIKTSQTWLTDHIYDDDILIKSGVILTVKAKVKMATGRKISIEGGATLRVEGGTLTVGNVKSMCDRQDTGPFWKGIELGVNNSAIANVFFSGQAIMELSYSGLFNVGNSYVTGSGSEFLNNRSSIDMETPTRSGFKLQFTNCKFILNNDYPGSDLFHQIRLGNGSALFVFCTIDNQTAFTTAEIAGIREIGTSLRVMLAPKIKGYYYGINALAGGGTYNIFSSHFEKCHIGLRTEAVNNFFLVNNTFTIGKYGNKNNGFGMQMDQGSQFVINSNDFLKGSDPLPQHGLLLNKSHESEKNFISKDNTFTDLSFGINLNRGPNANLFITCNDFTNCTEDIYVNPQAMINLVQKFIEQAAGNTFSKMSNTFNYDNVIMPDITYWYNGNNPLEDPVKIKNIIKKNEPRQSGVPRCQENPIDPTTGTEAIYDAHYYSLINQINPLESSLNQLLDNGNTFSIINQIQSANSSNAESLYNSIAQYSPNVSSQVIQAVWIRSDLFTPENRYLLILNNPVCFLESTIQIMVNEPSSGITPSMVEAINNMSIPTTGARYTLVMQIEEKKYELDMLVRSMSNYHNNNDLNIIDLNLKWLERSNSVSATMEAALIALNHGYSTNLTNYLNQLYVLQSSSNSSSTQYEINQFLQFMNLMIPVFQDGRYEGSLNQVEQTSLLNFAVNSNSWAQDLAKGILAFYYNIQVPIQALKQDKRKIITEPFNSIQLKQTINNNIIHNDFKIYPNPFKNELTITSLSDLDIAKTKIEIVDLHGRIFPSKLKEIDKNKLRLNTSDLQSGIYILKLFTNEKIIFYSKLVK